MPLKISKHNVLGNPDVMGPTCPHSDAPCSMAVVTLMPSKDWSSTPPLEDLIALISHPYAPHDVSD